MTSYGTGGSSLMMATDNSSLSDKSSLREQFKKLRSKMTEAEAEAFGQRALKHFLRLRAGVQWLMYAPIQGEISTKALFDFASATRGDKVFMPRMKGSDLSFHRLEKWDELKEEGHFPQPPAYAQKWNPEQGTVIIVPGLGFDYHGHRLGFGKGCYDRLLAEHPHFPRLALAYDFQIVPSLGTPEPHDAQMDFVISPSAVWGTPRVL